MDAIIGSICIPGERLSSTEKHQGGTGTYSRQGYIFSSLTGTVELETKNDTKLIKVKSKNQVQSIPEISSIATCKVTQITTRFAKCKIIAINNIKLSSPFRGMIRREDIRTYDRDRVEIFKSFRPGDIVLAKVISLGDASCYLLTTAELELGVVIARSEHGTIMIPLSHNLMQCPSTFEKENRKVARPQKEHIEQPT